MIARLWNWLFYACRHEWIEVERPRVHYDGAFSKGIYVRVIMKCKHCGDWKKRDLR